MTQEWVDQKNKEVEEQILKERGNLFELIDSRSKMTAEEKQSLREWVENEENDAYPLLSSGCLNRLPQDPDWRSIKEALNRYEGALRRKGMYSRYIDSEPRYFDGDVIITDPCYIMNHENDDSSKYPSWWDYVTKTTSTQCNDGGRAYTRYIPPSPEDYPDCRQKTADDPDDSIVGTVVKKNGMFSPTLYDEWAAYREAEEEWNNVPHDDWDRCECGYDMEALGIKNYMTRDTLYGDWGCTVFDSDTNKPIGEFCADAGLVSVFLLDEVKAYNPNYNEQHIAEKDWTVTLIKDFKGEVQFIVERLTGKYEEDTKYWKAGEVWEDYAVRVVGHGINKVTGKPINFSTAQTSL